MTRAVCGPSAGATTPTLVMQIPAADRAAAVCSTARRITAWSRRGGRHAASARAGAAA
ncbi:hypothetical protein ACIOFV_19785 [Streptomyces mirabilis]|uniref:hypothetical protein n=1 Tax=Streptomyces mirabilis TaxID=68239 RepID=UPI00381FDF98